LKEDMSEMIAGHHTKPLRVYMHHLEKEHEVLALDPSMPAKMSVPEWFLPEGLESLVS